MGYQMRLTLVNCWLQHMPHNLISYTRPQWWCNLQGTHCKRIGLDLREYLNIWKEPWILHSPVKNRGELVEQTRTTNWSVMCSQPFQSRCVVRQSHVADPESHCPESLPQFLDWYDRWYPYDSAIHTAHMVYGWCPWGVQQSLWGYSSNYSGISLHLGS
jgi:hypothetical protein